MACDSPSITVFFCTFSSVTLHTRHLTVFCRGHAAVLPGCDVVGLHFLQLEVLAAVGANVTLSFIGLPPHLLVEQTEIKVAQVTRELVLVDATLAFNFIILYRFTDLFLQRIGVVDVLVVVVVELAPVQALHFLAINMERGAYLCDDGREVSPQFRGVHVVLMLRHVFAHIFDALLSKTVAM